MIIARAASGAGAQVVKALVEADKNNDVVAARAAVKQAREQLDAFEKSPPTLEQCIKTESGRSMSNSGIFILCGSWMGSLFLASHVGGAAGLGILAFGLAGAPTLGFWALHKSAVTKANQRYEASQAKHQKLQQSLDAATKHRDELLRKLTVAGFAPGSSADIAEDDDVVDVNGFQIPRNH